MFLEGAAPWRLNGKGSAHATDPMFNVFVVDASDLLCVIFGPLGGPNIQCLAYNIAAAFKGRLIGS